MPNVSDETRDAAAEQPAPDAPSPIDEMDLDGMFPGLGIQQADDGEPEPPKAVDKSDVEDKPVVEEPAAGEPDSETKEKPEVEQASEAELAVNFEGYDDDDKTIWEKLLKEGHVSEEFYDKQRKGHLMHADYTRKTMKVSDDRKAFKAEQEKDETDLGFLRQIRDDKDLHEIFMKMQRGEYETVEGSDDLISRKEAEKLMEARESEKTARVSKRKKAFDDKLEEIRGMATGLMAEHGIEPEIMRNYLQSEGQEFLNPDDEETAVLEVDVHALSRGVMSRHKLAAAEAKAAKLEKQLEQRTSKAERTSKQSSPPPKRLSVNTPMDTKAKTLQEMGIETDGSNVQGFGHPASQI